MSVEQYWSSKHLHIRWFPEVRQLRRKSIHLLKHGRRKQGAENSDKLNLFVLCLKEKNFLLEIKSINGWCYDNTYYIISITNLNCDLRFLYLVYKI